MKRRNALSLLSGVIISASFFWVSCKQKNEAAGSNESAQQAQSAQQPSETTPYPFDFCIVAGDTLGVMGEAQVLIHNGQVVKFCCKKCIPRFQKSPEKYLIHLKDPHFNPFTSEIVPGDHHTHSHGSEGSHMNFMDDLEQSEHSNSNQ